MIRYSIIVPWHSKDALLERALSSVPSREDVEVIPIEDVERRGAGWARNVGLDRASGKWVLFMDSDDFFEDGFLDLLDRHFDDEADVVYFGVRAVVSETLEPSQRVAQKIGRLHKYASDPAKIGFYCRYCFAEPWSKMVRRSMVVEKGIRFDETSCANDFYFSVQCGVHAGKVAYDPSVLYVVTERIGSVSRNYFDTPQRQLDRLWVYWRVQLLLDKNRIPLYPFYGLWMMCRKKGAEEYRLAREFCSQNGIGPLRIAWGCLRRIVRKHLKWGVPNCD